MPLYAIRDKESGEFYIGTGRGGLSAAGFFSSVSAAKCSMNSHGRGVFKEKFDSTKHELVEFEIVEKGIVEQ